MRTAMRELGGLDTLVVNAVRWPALTTARFEELPADEWRAVLRANVEGAFTVTQAALPALRASGRGRIVLISSGAAEEGHPVMPPYVAAKAVLHGARARPGRGRRRRRRAHQRRRQPASPAR